MKIMRSGNTHKKESTRQTLDTISNFHAHGVKCIDKYAEQNDGRKSWVKKQNFKKGFEKAKHACSVRDFHIFGFHCQSVFEAAQPD